MSGPPLPCLGRDVSSALGKRQEGGPVMVYVGVDLHRKRSHVVALDPTGQVMLSRRVGNAPAEFLRIFGELEPLPIEVVFEATYGWSWFADLLADVGHRCSYGPSAGYQGDLGRPGQERRRRRQDLRTCANTL